MEYHTKKKSNTERILKLFSHKLSAIEKRQSYTFLLIFVLLLCQIGQIFYVRFVVDQKVTPVTEEKIVYRSNKVLFLGDSITEFYDLDKFFDNDDYVNSGISGNTAEDILNDMKKRVYDYSPKQIFLLVGTNDDMATDLEDDEAIQSIENIISRIKENLPDTELYVESIYPINDSDDDKIKPWVVGDRKNENIREMNEQIKQICEDYEVTYIDLYSILSDEDGNLKLEYTEEGLHISEEGYQVITDELKKYL